MKIKYRNKYLTLDDKILIAKDYNAGMPILDICEKYKIAKITMYRALKDVGVEGVNEEKKGE